MRASSSSLAARGPVTDLTATLLAAWSTFGANDAKGAVDTIDKLQGPEWYGIFKDMHAGLILDLANNKKEAGKRLEHSYKLELFGAAGDAGLCRLPVAQRRA